MAERRDQSLAFYRQGIDRPLDVFELVKMGVPENLAIRVCTTGQIPDRGPGSYSIPRTFETARRQAREVRQTPKNRASKR